MWMIVLVLEADVASDFKHFFCSLYVLAAPLLGLLRIIQTCEILIIEFE